MNVLVESEAHHLSKSISQMRMLPGKQLLAENKPSPTQYCLVTSVYRVLDVDEGPLLSGLYVLDGQI